HFPRGLGLGLEFCQLASMMGLNVDCGVAMERPDKSLLRILPGKPDYPADGGERMMAQPQRHDLLFALCDFLLSARCAGVAARPTGRVCRLVHVSLHPDGDQATATYAMGYACA